MRLLKAQNTNLRNLYGKGVRYDINDQVIVDSANSLLIPKGTTAERPATPNNGHIRYNTEDNQFEAYQNGAWREIRFKEPNQDPGIVVQTLGFGDAVETTFGPLDSQDTDYPVPAAAQNILVFVENVYQLPTTNYTLVQNPGNTISISTIISIDGVTGYPTVQTSGNHGFTAGDVIHVTGVESSIDDNLEDINTDDSTSPSSHTIANVPALNQIEIAVDVTGANLANYVSGTGQITLASTITGQPFADGWYVRFSSAPDLDKPITVLHNFDK